MHGNVWEWTQDCGHDNYQNAPTNGSAWLAGQGGDCTRRVVRGGGWDNDPWILRSAFRSRNIAGEVFPSLGFASPGTYDPLLLVPLQTGTIANSVGE